MIMMILFFLVMNFFVQQFHCLSSGTADNDSYCRQCYTLFIGKIKKTLQKKLITSVVWPVKPVN